MALGLAAALIPACMSNKTKAAPNITGAFPASGATVPQNPMVVFQFDRAMDPAFMTPAYFAVVDTTGPTANFQIEFESAANQARIVVTDILQPGHSYNIFATASIQSAAGTAMGSAEGITVTVSTAQPTLFQPISGFPANVSAYPGAVAGEIDLYWDGSTNFPAAGDNNPGPGTEQVQNTSGPPPFPAPSAVTPLQWYDVYISTTLNGVSYLDATGTILAPFKTVSATSAQLTGLVSGTTYYIKVVPRDAEGNVFEAQLSETVLKAP
jgi:hypothetical protein